MRRRPTPTRSSRCGTTSSAGTDQLEQKLKDDPKAVFSEDYDPFGDVNKALNEYGLKECGG